ncbi:MAG: BrxA/BrxB family bacilliredoxin [Saprospiraceae bacterium]|nr:BrxA/BrxB family bacilliredoxin [Saprospiraceae bacterium]
MYPVELTAPMTKDLTDFGFSSLTTPEEVDALLQEPHGTVLVMVNSVCGCAAANARPGVKLALHRSENRPDHLATVFAGVDREATEKAREYFLPYPPSSPAIALFKDGELVHFLERHQIEGRPASMIADNLMAAFARFC